MAQSAAVVEDIPEAKHDLELAEGKTRHVCIRLDSNLEPCLFCATNKGAGSEIKIPLKDSTLLRTVTEDGPVLSLQSQIGRFHFSYKSEEAVKFWISYLEVSGCKQLHFSDIYQNLQFIGEGSFSSVFATKNRITGEFFVVKAVDKTKMKVCNVYTEISILSRISHPYIVRLYETFEEGNHVCLIMEHLTGGDLFSWLSNHGYYTESEARDAIHRVLLALQFLHSKGIAHRDIKTENLILENQATPSRLKLIDFGLASITNSQEMQMRCGSPGYVAPEILQNQPYGTKVDIFSAGVILYTMIAGKPPFVGQNVQEVLKRNLRGKIVYPDSRWKHTSTFLKDLISWMCCRDPAMRCTAMQALLHPFFVEISHFNLLPKSFSTEERASQYLGSSSKRAIATATAASTPRNGRNLLLMARKKTHKRLPFSSPCIGNSSAVSSSGNSPQSDVKQAFPSKRSPCKIKKALDYRLAASYEAHCNFQIMEVQHRLPSKRAYRRVVKCKKKRLLSHSITSLSVEVGMERQNRVDPLKMREE